jgi:hypothetical protein
MKIYLIQEIQEEENLQKLKQEILMQEQEAVNQN